MAFMESSITVVCFDKDLSAVALRPPLTFFSLAESAKCTEVNVRLSYGQCDTVAHLCTLRFCPGVVFAH